MVEETKQIAESAGALGALGVDGKLFLAQLVNFGVVLFVMWKWVYTPLLKVMDERTAKIEKGLKDAEDSAAALRIAGEEKDRIVAEARAKAKGIIEEANATGEAARQDAVRKAKEEVERVVAQGKERLQSEKQAMLDGAKQELAGLVALATERVVGDAIDAAGDDKLIRAALKDLA
jgi:F-type H+-transporting ATPase subunit b